MNVFLFSKSNWNIINFRYNLIKEIKKNNFKVITVSQKDKYQNDLKKNVFKLININYKNRKITFLSDFINLILIVYYIIKFKPTIFISFNIKPIILSGLASKLFNISNIITITGLGTVFEKKTSTLVKKIAIFLYYISIKKNDHIIFQNNYDLKFFLKKKIISKKNNFYVVGGSGVNINHFNFRKLNSNKKKLHFTFIGRLLKSKGIDSFLETIEKYFYNKELFEFSVIGDYENINDFNYKIFKLLKENHIINYYNHQNDIREFIYNSDCIVLPSYREGTSKVLLEAMSCGRPIITTNVPGCNYLTNNDKNGILCEKDNIVSLKNSLLKFKNLSNHERNELSINARNFIIKNFDEKFVIERYINLIKKLNESK